MNPAAPKSHLMARAADIRLLTLDVDGVLTNGQLFIDSNGEEIKAFNTLDGHGIKLLQRAGLHVAIISGRDSRALRQRASELGIQWLRCGREDKWQALAEIRQALSIEDVQIACMGDDWPDLLIMRRVGLALTVPNAHPAVREYAHWQSHACGGHGAVREACDLLLRAQGLYDDALARYTAE